MDWQDKLKQLLPAGYAPQAPDAAPAEQGPAQRGPLTVTVDRRRKGKIATIVSGFTIPDADIDALASKLKKRLGCGGAARGGEILIQGDRPAEVAAALRALGFAKVKV